MTDRKIAVGSYFAQDIKKRLPESCRDFNGFTLEITRDEVVCLKTDAGKTIVMSPVMTGYEFYDKFKDYLGVLPPENTKIVIEYHKNKIVTINIEAAFAEFDNFYEQILSFDLQEAL